MLDRRLLQIVFMIILFRMGLTEILDLGLSLWKYEFQWFVSLYIQILALYALKLGLFNMSGLHNDPERVAFQWISKRWLMN